MRSWPGCTARVREDGELRGARLPAAAAACAPLFSISPVRVSVLRQCARPGAVCGTRPRWGWGRAVAGAGVACHAESERASDPPALRPSRCRLDLAGRLHNALRWSSAGDRGRNPPGLGIQAGRDTAGAHLCFARRAGVEDHVSLCICCSQNKRTVGKHCILSSLSSRSESFQYRPGGTLLLSLMSVCKYALCVDKFFSTY